MFLGTAFLPAVVMPVGLQAQDGYMFRAPVVSINLRVGASLPTASDPLHRFFMDELTLSRRDFASVAIGGDVAVHVNPRVDLLGSISLARTDRGSWFRDWVDENDLPIEQSTRIRRTPVLVGVRLYARDRGESAGRFAWVPNHFLPYVGGGAGVMWYELEQEGWFVDFDDLDIFSDFFYASGSTPLAGVFGGAEWWPTARLGFNVEGRFTYARATLRGDFRDFDHIDLSGFQLMAGLSTRF
jgi:hypothetical protein